MALTASVPSAPLLVPARPEDLPALLALLSEAFRNYVRALGRAEPGPYPWLPAAIAEGRVRCVYEGGAPVAVVVTSEDRAEGTVTIDILAVDPSRSRKGLGSLILAEVEVSARSAGFRTLRLHTLAACFPLVALYSRHGFVATRIGPHPDGRDDYPRLFMAKAIA